MSLCVTTPVEKTVHSARIPFIPVRLISTAGASEVPYARFAGAQDDNGFVMPVLDAVSSSAAESSYLKTLCTPETEANH